MIIALFAGIGFFVGIVADQGGIHGDGDIVAFGYNRYEIASITLLIVAVIASGGSLLLFFSKQKRVQRAIILLLGFGIIFAGIVFAYLFLFRISR